MQELFVPAGKINLHVRLYPREAPTVMFLHFGGGNLHMWQGVVPFFQNKYQIILADLRGHGQSDRPSSGYHIDDMAQDVVLIMQNLKLKNAHVVGSSLGAEVGLSLAANYPPVVSSLVCEGALFNEFGPYGLWKGTEDEFKEHAAQTLARMHAKSTQTYPSVDALVEASRQVLEKRGWWNEIVDSVERNDAIRMGEGEYKSGWSLVAEEYTKNYLFCRFEEYYRRVNCPLLMMPDVYPGQDDREKEVMHALFKLVKQGQIVNVPEWVHPFGWMLTPEAGSRAVLEFLAEIK